MRGDRVSADVRLARRRNVAGAAAPAGARVFVRPDGAQESGRVGRGFHVLGTDEREHSAVTVPPAQPGGDIGARHSTGSYARMPGEVPRVRVDG